MSKALKIFFITLLSLLIIGIVTFLVLVLTDRIDLSRFRFTSLVSKELVFEKEYDNLFEKVVIDSDAANIEFKTSENNKIKVLVYGDEKRTEVVADTMLTINTTTKPCKFFCINTRISKVIVYLPITYQNPITVDTKYGDIKGDTIYSIDAITDYGDIKFDSITNYFKLDTDFGDIRLGKINITKDSSATTDFGDIRIGETNEVNISAKTDLGDVKIQNNYTNSEINLNLQTDFGDIKVNN